MKTSSASWSSKIFRCVSLSISLSWLDDVTMTHSDVCRSVRSGTSRRRLQASGRRLRRGRRSFETISTPPLPPLGGTMTHDDVIRGPVNGCFLLSSLSFSYVASCSFLSSLLTFSYSLLLAPCFFILLLLLASSCLLASSVPFSSYFLSLLLS